MEELEIKEKIEETEKGHEESQSSKLRIGLLIAALAALLALLEAGGKSAQTEAINANLQASDLWVFFQAKTARMTTIQTAAESAKLSLLSDLPAETKAAIQKQIDAWNATVARYDSEPQTAEGRKELTERAKEAEAERDRKLAAYHLFELGSAASQLAIVLALGCDHHRAHFPGLSRWCPRTPQCRSRHHCLAGPHYVASLVFFPPLQHWKRPRSTCTACGSMPHCSRMRLR